jgi:predicted transcriptional regulator
MAELTSAETLGARPAFGRHMKQWRKQRGLSQLDLAVQADISQRHISFIETGRSRPGADVINKIAEALCMRAECIPWSERQGAGSVVVHGCIQ